MDVLVLAELVARDWINAGVIAASSIVLAVIVRRVTKQTIRLRRGRRNARHYAQTEVVDLTGRAVVAVILAVGAFYTLRALNVQIGPLLGALGVGTLLIAFGLQSLLVNIVGSVVLYARRPFRRGDQISTNDFEGTVIDINTMATVLLSYDGETVHVPNSSVLTQPLVNWTHEPIRRSVLPISLPYGCDVPKALSIMGRAARTVLDDDQLPPADAIATGFGANGIDAELRFYHYSEHLEAQFALTQVVTAVDVALRDAGIVVPFPQVVLHDAESRLHQDGSTGRSRLDDERR